MDGYTLVARDGWYSELTLWLRKNIIDQDSFEYFITVAIIANCIWAGLKQFLVLSQSLSHLFLLLAFVYIVLHC